MGAIAMGQARRTAAAAERQVPLAPHRHIQRIRTTFGGVRPARALPAAAQAKNLPRRNRADFRKHLISQSPLLFLRRRITFAAIRRLAVAPRRSESSTLAPAANQDETAYHPERLYALRPKEKGKAEAFPFSGFTGNRTQPTQTRALRNMRIQPPSSSHSSGRQEFCTARNTRSGCGIMMVTRPSRLVRPVMPRGEPFGLAG